MALNNAWVKKVIARKLKKHSMVTTQLLLRGKINSFFFFSFMAAPMACGSSQARDQIQATAAIYTTARATLDPLTHCAGLGIEPMPLW